MKYGLLLAAALVAGCSHAEVIDDQFHNGHKVVVPVSMANSAFKELVVRYHPTDATRAVVQPRYGSRVRQNFLNGSFDWATNLPEYRKLYAATLTDQLAKDHRNCAIASDHAYPEFSMIEFKLTCT